MEVRFYDQQLNLKYIVENFTSLLWDRFYNECGSFQLECPATDQNIKACQMGYFIWIKGKDDMGVIEEIVITDEGGGDAIVVAGRFLQSVLDRRLVTTNFSGRVETAMRQLFTTAASFPNIVLGPDNGFTETVQFNATYRDLLTYEQNLAKSANFGIRFRPDVVNKIITFEIFKGVDRTETQWERPRVVFSDEYENLTGASYKNNTQLWKNVCVVGGQSNGDYKVYETVGDTSATGYERREYYYEASDVQSEGITWAAYIAALRQRGQTILQQSQESETFECTVRINGNFTYGIDYDIGDVVTVNKESWGKKKDLRVTEAKEIYESEIPRVELTLGTPLPTTINWEV